MQISNKQVGDVLGQYQSLTPSVGGNGNATPSGSVSGSKGDSLALSNRAQEASLVREASGTGNATGSKGLSIRLQGLSKAVASGSYLPSAVDIAAKMLGQ